MAHGNDILDKGQKNVDIHQSVACHIRLIVNQNVLCIPKCDFFNFAVNYYKRIEIHRL